MFPNLSPGQMRWSGWILFAGSLLLLIVNFLSFSLAISTSHLPSIPLSALELVGGIALVIGLPAPYIRQSKEVASLGLIGFILLWFSSLLITVILSGYAIFYSATTPEHAGSAAASAPLAIQYIASTGLLQIIGTLLYGVASIRADIFPKSAGVLLGVAVAFSLPQLFLAGAFPALIGAFSTYFLLAGLARFGYALARWPRYGEDEPQREETTTMKDFVQ
jgi:hypothetical protein